MNSIPHLLLEKIETCPENDAIRYMENGQYKSYSYRELGEEVEYLLNGLVKLGLKTGDRVAILSENRPEWTISDFAILSFGGVLVPIPTSLNSDQMTYILKDSGSKAIILENKKQYHQIDKIRKNLPSLEHIISISKVITRKTDVMLYADLLEKGKSEITQNENHFPNSVDSIGPDDICSIVYTSETERSPKGVILHHRGFMQNIMNTDPHLNFSPKDVVISTLPLNQLNERVFGQWCPIYRGATILYAENTNNIIEGMNSLQPSVFIGTSDLFENLVGELIDLINRCSAHEKKFYHWALSTSREYCDKQNSKKTNILLKIKYTIAQHLALTKIKNKLSAPLRLIISTGTPLSEESIIFFEALGLQVTECYGLTETHGPIALSPLGTNPYGSYGALIEGIEVRNGHDGEILLRGDSIMGGYINKPESTWDVLDDKGWLYTGYLGHIDEQNYLYITGPKKKNDTLD